MGILDDKIQLRRGKTPQGGGRNYNHNSKDLQTAIYNANGYKQSLFFVSSFGKSKQNSIAFLVYMTQENTLSIKTKDGTKVPFNSAVDKVNEWVDDTKKRKGANRFTMHLVLQSLPGADAKRAEKGFQEFLKKEFPKNDYLYAFHIDKESPHAHVTVKMQNTDGKKITAQKKELYEWRESLAVEMRGQGFRVAATSRQSRGLTGKSLPMSSGIKFKMHSKELKQSIERNHDKENITKWRERYEKMSQLLNESNDPKLKSIGEKIASFNKKLTKNYEKQITK